MPEKRSKREYVVAIAAFLSLLATILTLSGYGVALSIEQFDLPHQVLFGSSLDLLDLSCWVVVYFFENISRVSFWEEYVSIFSGTLWGIPALFTILFTAGLYFKYVESKGGVRRYLPARLRKITLRPDLKEGLHALAVKIGLFSALTWIAISLLWVMGALAIVCIAAFLITAPSIGLAAGNLYISEYVVGPEQCNFPRPRVERMAKKPTSSSKLLRKATCVQIRNERGLCEQGRVIFATTSAILLYQPDTGSAYRIPTSNAVVESIGVLDAAKGCLPSRTIAPAQASAHRPEHPTETAHTP